MSVYKRGNTWWIRLHIEGVSIRRSAGKTATRAQAQALERKIITDYHASKAGNPVSRELVDALDRWHREYVGRLKSARQIEIRMLYMLDYAKGRTVSEIALVANEVQGALFKAGRSAATVNRYLADLRRVGNLCVDWEWLDRAPRIKLHKEPTGREVFLTIGQVKALADACPSEASRTAVLLLAMTGLRRGELLALEAADVKDGRIVVQESKSGKPRIVPVPDEALPLLSQIPLPIGRWTLHEHWDKARKACGLEHVRLHDLRHTYASRLAQGGIDLYTIQRLLGHTGPTMTQRYAHLQTAGLGSVVKKAGVK